MILTIKKVVDVLLRTWYINKAFKFKKEIQKTSWQEFEKWYNKYADWLLSQESYGRPLKTE